MHFGLYHILMSRILPLLLRLPPCSPQANLLRFFLNRLHNPYGKDSLRTIKVDLKLSTLKPIHAKTVSKVYEHLKSDKGKQVILNGFRAAGITEAVTKIRENPKSGLNPY